MTRRRAGEAIPPAAAVVGNRIYVLGGYHPDPLDLVEIYDVTTNSWSTGPSMPHRRYGGSAAVAYGKIYVAGGGDGGQLWPDVDVFDPATNTWSSTTPLPTPRESPGASFANGMIYVIGGCIGQYCVGVNEALCP